MPADPTSTPDPPSAEEPGPCRRLPRRLPPEERSVGSDDPQAQAGAILAESQERTEHPDPDASSQSPHATSEEAAQRGEPDDA